MKPNRITVSLKVDKKLWGKFKVFCTKKDKKYSEMIEKILKGKIR